ncbi:hypothetical protein MKW98_014320 [Papaver atlanticum]|uniref:U5 small nuclear ribonucleoprotein TSSC4 n=1 Tax=Papaver atlanticum TaxID=357466 RepID=A0AAD4XIV7_9MAGN|nr:hypothetical protein MKW98_014320 [Papaver atlanticum]
MDDSFRVRVDKIFGGLDGPGGSKPTDSIRSLWSLSDAEVEKKEWRKQHPPEEEEEIIPSSFHQSFIAKNDNKKKIKNGFGDFDDDLFDFDDLEDDGEDGDKENPGSSSKQGSNGGGGDGDDDEREIRASMGLDSTLDNEDEEDEFDKFAVGREKAGDRTYLKDVTDYGDYLNSYNVIPSSFKDHVRDPRAILPEKDSMKEDVLVGSEGVGDAGVIVNQDVGNLKPILKRKEKKSGSKSQKRVRFDPECLDNSSDQEFENPNSMNGSSSSMGITLDADKASFLPRRTSTVPDYLLNPGKYTQYSFDSTDDDNEQSNKQACMDFLNTIRKAQTTESQQEDIFELPKSVTFVPKKKTTDDDEASTKRDTEMNHDQGDSSKESNVRRAGIPLGVAVVEMVESEACAMEEDEEKPTIKDTSESSKKPGRQYRPKVICQE